MVLLQKGCGPISLTAVLRKAFALRVTHSCDVGFHRQQVEESKELDGEDGVDLCGRQHQHSQGQQHLGIPLQCSAAAAPLTHKQRTVRQRVTRKKKSTNLFKIKVRITQGQDNCRSVVSFFFQL